MNVGAFAIVAIREREIGRPVEVADFAGWGYRRPLLSIAMVVFMLSLAGFPPTGGFLGKLYIWSAAVANGQTYLAIAGAIATAVGLVYYLRVPFALFDRDAAVPAVPSAGELPARRGRVGGGRRGRPRLRDHPLAADRPRPDGELVALRLRIVEQPDAPGRQAVAGPQALGQAQLLEPADVGLEGSRSRPTTPRGRRLRPRAGRRSAAASRPSTARAWLPGRCARARPRARPRPQSGRRSSARSSIRGSTPAKWNAIR